MPDVTEIGTGPNRFPIQILSDGSWVKGGKPIENALLYRVNADTLEQATALAREHAAPRLKALADALEERKRRVNVDGIEIHRGFREVTHDAHVHFSRRSRGRGDHDSVVFCVELDRGISIDIELSPERFVDLMTNHYFRTTAVITRPGSLGDTGADLLKLGDIFIPSPDEETSQQLRERVGSIMFDQQILTQAAEIGKNHNVKNIALFSERGTNEQNEDEEGVHVTVFKT